MLPSTLANTPPWAWRLLRDAASDDERFLIEFLHEESQLVWSGDEIARTEDEARAYAALHGISPGSFTKALEQLRAANAAGHAD